MGLLKKKLDDKYGKLAIVPQGSVSEAVACPTGITLLDYYTATVCESKVTNDNYEKGEEFLSFGLPMGKITLLIGNSGGGKTTAAFQIAHNMTAPYNGDIINLDFERQKSNLYARLKQTTGMTREEFEESVTVYSHLTMSTEFLKELIFEIKEMKEKLPVKDMIDWTDLDGRPIKIYPPTVIILDSIPNMKPAEVLSDKKLDSNMLYGKMSLANGALIKTILGILEAYNITILAINHITANIVTNAYATKKVILPGLPEDENIPGGKEWIYNASAVIRFTSGAELKKEKTYTDGRMTDVRILKTRTGFNNIRQKWVLDAKTGFNEAFTLFEYAKENGIITGTGRGYSFKNNPLDKFTAKTFSELFNTNEEFKEAFMENVEEKLLEFVEHKYSDDYSSSEDDADQVLSEEFDDDEDD
ncbi:MAG: hypothetical protein [Bacteriophage sp.]|nr:MAG: hypothetical protein [Bacteriophage sp.]